MLSELFELFHRIFKPYRTEGALLPSEVTPEDEDPEEIQPEDVKEESPYRTMPARGLAPAYKHEYEIPKSRKDVISVYGDCGQKKLSKKWERENMILLKGLPGSWNKGKGRMYCHRKMAPALKEALRRCEEYGVLDYIYRMGCFKWRHIQHNSDKPLSFHSWGISVDINPKDNKLKRYKRGKAPEPHSEEWWLVWPHGVPKLLVQAFKEAGFSWGGDWQTVPDPMHMELVG